MIQHSASGNLPEEHENIHSKRYLHLHVHCSIIYNRQDIETT